MKRNKKCNCPAPHLPPSELDKHMCWLFLACKIGQTNEATNEFLIRLKQACENAFEQLDHEYKTNQHKGMVNAIPFISGHLARLVEPEKTN